MVSARETALKILYETEKKDGYLNILFDHSMQQSELAREDRALVKELVFGTVQYQITLDYAIGCFSNIRLKKISPYILQILRLGLYQLYFMNRIPMSAAVNESVKLAKKYGHSASAGFVNALLHRAVREKKLPLPDRKNSETCYFSVKYSHPEDLTRWYQRMFGDRAEALLSANNQRPPLSIRVNPLKTTKAGLVKQLEQEGVIASPSLLTDCGLIIERGKNPEQLQMYREGHFSIQGQASQLAALALAPKPGDLVMDMCSAPGGKTAHLAELMENLGEILAFDLYEHRLKAVEDNVKRLGIGIVKTAQMDAAQEKCEYFGTADKILLDVPCSGLGIIRRKPDIKYKKGLVEFNELRQIQKNILNICSKYLKIEGEMVYSTCTVNPEENTELIEEFLKSHPEFELLPAGSTHMSQDVQTKLSKGYVTLYPDLDGCDGFFICKMKRRA